MQTLPADTLIDETISRSVRTMLAHHRLKVTDVPDRIIGLTKSTIYRRLDGEQKWQADEVWAIAELFGLPIEQFYTGDVRPAESRLSESPVRLSRDIESAGHEPYPGEDSRFSGSDIGRLCSTTAVSAA